MANFLRGNPLIVDTASSGTSYLSETSGMPFNWDVTWVQVLWRDFNGAGEQVDVQDGAGHSIFKLTANATTPNPVGTSIGGRPSIAHSGLRVPTLTSGVVEIYLA
jgi:hypothetical protein